MNWFFKWWQRNIERAAMELHPPSMAMPAAAPKPSRNYSDNTFTAFGLLCCRMRWGEWTEDRGGSHLDHMWGMGVQYADAFKAGEKVFVFIVANGQHVTIEDDAAMYPSDALVTQIRMLESKP